MLRKRHSKSEKSKEYIVILVHYSSALRAKLKGQDDWENISKKSNDIKLLKSV